MQQIIIALFFLLIGFGLGFYLNLKSTPRKEIILPNDNIINRWSINSFPEELGNAEENYWYRRGYKAGISYYYQVLIGKYRW